MNKNKVNISQVESFFERLLKNKVSKNVFFTDLPDAIDSSWKEMIVVDCNAISDMDAFGRGTVLLLVYVPPIGKGLKDVATFSRIESKINDSITNNKDATYRIKRRDTYGDYDQDKNLFVNVIEITLMILT